MKEIFFQRRFMGPIRQGLWIIGGMLLWFFPGKAVQDVLVWGAFLYALLKVREVGIAPWKTWQGLLFLALFCWAVITFPLGAYPAVSFREWVRGLDMLAGAFAISILFRTDQSLRRAFVVSGAVLTIALLFDLIRLYFALGEELFTAAHFYEPFFMGHPSNSSIAAGVSFWLLFSYGAGYSGRYRGWVVGFVILGMAMDMLYILTLAARGPQIAMLGSLFVLPFVLPGKRFAVAGLMAVLILVVIGVSQRERLNARFGNERTMSGLNDRTKVWAHTWELSMQRPWTGYGWGNRVFERVYYESDPPESIFHFPHCHQYWLSRIFAWGWPGLVLGIGAWAGLVGGVYRVLLQRRSWRDRSLPAGLLGILAVLHLYGMGDQPQGLVPFFLLWSIPCGLVLIAEQRKVVRGGDE